MRVVIDTNVYISALLNVESVPGFAVERAMRMQKVLMSAPLMAEIQEVLQRKKIRRFIPGDAAERFLRELFTVTEWVTPNLRISECRDPRDNHLLELAVAGEANFVLTGDADLLALHPFRRIAILSPAQYVSSHD